MANYPTIDALIAQFEGFGASQPNGQPTLATRNNNPGNLIYNSTTAGMGATPGEGGFAAFANVQAGAAAEDAIVTNYANQGDTLDQLIANWAPANAPGNSPAATANYQNFLSSNLGVAGSTPISTAEPAGQATPTTSKSSFLSGLLNFFNGIGVPGFTANSSPSITSWFTDPTRIGFFILGLIMIIGGIYLFKPAQNVTVQATRAARRAGEFLAA